MVVVTIALLAGGFRWRVNAFDARRRELEIQVQRTNQIRQMEAERNRILELSQDLICIAGLDGYFKYINPAWKKKFGYTDAELMSKPFLDFVHPDDRAKTMREFETLAAGRQTVDFENRHTQKDGNFRYLSWMATPLPDEERVYAVARDISERKQVEQELKIYQNRLQALASQLTIVEEKERRRLAAELHDHVCQSLALANIQLDSARKSIPESKLADQLNDISGNLLKTLKDTKQLMRELSSSLMHEIGLSSAISEWLEGQIGNKHHLKTEFIENLSDDRRNILDSNVRAILFRNVRELLVNVVKHAHANKVSVRIEDRNSSIRIIIEDDGIGFDPRAMTHAGSDIGGFGLFSIGELMADLGGSLKVVSEPGKGCTAILSAPFSVDDSQERD